MTEATSGDDGYKTANVICVNCGEAHPVKLKITTAINYVTAVLRFDWLCLDCGWNNREDIKLVSMKEESVRGNAA